MILPNKDIELSSSYIGISALILSALKITKFLLKFCEKKQLKFLRNIN
ncbi:hypothetical protein [Mycoplasmopsis anatis]|uniref:Uncharacterized protein n=1 Tax=Mycoplasmopsis anatis 1340 TaxID=1034808 RepID=F9QCL7_9BACT|nr:hypothetical protein [Mycoplasmopsis anatis]EGS29513.1 hypothetical protein GIG_00867 [Mycoplasmopsis anatis 1340]VEU73943.1 Uncharacterised protein [Mycoplasmopsis anatis]